MAIVSNPTLYIPAWREPRARGAGIDLTTRTFNANSTSFGTYFAWICQADKTADLTRVAYRQVGRAGTGTKTLRIGIQNVSATTGLPDGTYRGYKDFTVDATSNAMVAQTMDTFSSGSAVSVTRGDVIAIVIEPISGFSATETMTYVGTFGTDSFNMTLSARPYNVANGTRVQGFGPFAYGSSSEWYGYPWGSKSSVSQTTQEVGARFKITNTQLSKVALRGIRLMTAQNWPWTIEFRVYDSVSGTTAITNGTMTYDSDQSSNFNTSSDTPLYCFFATSPEITVGQYYYLAMHRSSGTNDQSRIRIDMGTGNASYFDALNPGWESAYISRNTVGSGTFTVTDTVRLDCDFLFDGFEAAGGGGMLVHPGMTGRISG